MIVALAFYLFAAITVASGVMVVSSRNPVHSVLFLILAFFSAAGLFVLLGAEFLAMILVVVYVGAVAVLFMFVVMMLDIDFVALRQGFLRYLPIGGLIGLIMLVELLVLVGGMHLDPAIGEAIASPTPEGISNTQALGLLVYTHYVYLFQAAGAVLLVAMIGAIVLTHRRREGVRKQVVSEQVAVRPKDRITVHTIEPGKGI